MTRERFIAAVSSGPMYRGDAIVALSGDGHARLDVAVHLMRQTAAPRVLVTGAVDNPPHSLTAEAAERYLINRGLDPNRIVRLDGGMNTREEAVGAIAIAAQEGWKRLLVVTSPHHQYRSFLTFVQALIDAGKQDEIHVLNVSATQLRWGHPPPGMSETRLDLLDGELAKIEEYAQKGHVASYQAGLDYLLAWEGRV